LLLFVYGLGLWCLMPLSTIFQLYRGDQFLLVEEIGVSGENNQPVTNHWQTIINLNAKQIIMQIVCLIHNPNPSWSKSKANLCISEIHITIWGPSWSLDLQVPVQSVPITTNVVSLNPANGMVYSIQHYDSLSVIS
jgi:hypothetical protein